MYTSPISNLVLIDTLYQANGNIDFILMSQATFTRTSFTLRDALLVRETLFIEIHLINVHRIIPLLLSPIRYSRRGNL
ncbi:MAG: type II 3-dehydroquinate dehydratase [Candidatus Malihini olakiniferum]